MNQSSKMCYYILSKFTTSEEVRILKVMELILQKLDVVDVKHDFMINEKFQMSVYELNQLVNDF